MGKTLRIALAVMLLAALLLTSTRCTTDDSTGDEEGTRTVTINGETFYYDEGYSEEFYEKSSYGDYENVIYATQWFVSNTDYLHGLPSAGDIDIDLEFVFADELSSLSKGDEITLAYEDYGEAFGWDFTIGLNWYVSLHYCEYEESGYVDPAWELYYFAEEDVDGTISFVQCKNHYLVVDFDNVVFETVPNEYKYTSSSVREHCPEQLVLDGEIYFWDGEL